MKVAIVVLLWFLLFLMCWPLAVAAVVLIPLFWLLSLPFRMVFWIVEAVLKMIKTILFLPARLLGFRAAK